MKYWNMAWYPSRLSLSIVRKQLNDQYDILLKYELMKCLHIALGSSLAELFFTKINKDVMNKFTVLFLWDRFFSPPFFLPPSPCNAGCVWVDKNIFVSVTKKTKSPEPLKLCFGCGPFQEDRCSFFCYTHNSKDEN